ncbi:MAG: hypothetical protein ABEI52_06180 [Halobacteriaceae archaeon]
MTKKEMDRRQFLKYGGSAGLLGLAPLSGCTMVEGSQAPSKALYALHEWRGWR